jgi:group I intron endonuclease
VNKFDKWARAKQYVGSAVDLRVRLRTYFNRNALKRDNNMLICRALLKHGYSNFTLEILKYCSPEKCIKWEQLFLDLLNPEYNILKNAYSSLGYKHSAESRAKISATVKGIPKPWLSAPKTEEHKANISASMMGNNNGKNSSIKIEVTDLEVNTSTIYNSLGAAARALKISKSSISNYFSRNQTKPLKGRYVFSTTKI